MPRFMMLVIPKVYENASADFMPPAELVAKMTQYNESLTKAGVLLGLDGLQPPPNGARVRFSGGKPKVTDGPFAEAKEVVSYAVYDVRSKEEAVAWGTRFLEAHREHWPEWEGTTDLLKLFGPEDMPPAA